MNYFGEDDIYILAECTICKKVVKVRKDICVQGALEGIKIKNSLKCVCNREFSLINGVAKSLSLYAPGLNVVAQGNSLDIEFNSGKALIKKKGLIKKVISLTISDLLITEYKKAGLLQPGKIKLFYLSGKKKIELFTYFSKHNQSQFDQIYSEINRYVRETQGMCSVCKHVWHFNAKDVFAQTGKQMKNMGKDLLALGVFLPLSLLPNEQIQELERCPKCGTRAVTLSDVVNRK